MSTNRRIPQATVAALVFLVACACTPDDSADRTDVDPPLQVAEVETPKGWALYSWPDGETWMFSLVPDGNGPPAYYGTSPERYGDNADDVWVVGVPASTYASIADLELRIRSLGPDKGIFWYSGDHMTSSQGAVFGYPPNIVSADVVRMVERHGGDLWMVE
jgi:hypothetical protein